MNGTKYYINLQKTILSSELPRQTQYSLIIAIYKVRFEKCDCEIEKNKILKKREEFINLFSFNAPVKALDKCLARDFGHRDARHDFKTIDWNKSAENQIDSLIVGGNDKRCTISSGSEIDYLDKISDEYKLDGSNAEGYVRFDFTSNMLEDPNFFLEDFLKNIAPSLLNDQIYNIMDTQSTSFLQNISKRAAVSRKPYWWVCQTMQTLYDPASKLKYVNFGNTENHSVFSGPTSSSLPNVGFCWQDPSKHPTTIYKQWPLTGDANSVDGRASETSDPEEMLNINADLEMFWNVDKKLLKDPKWVNDHRNHSACIFMRGADGNSRWADKQLAAKTSKMKYSFEKAIKSTAYRLFGLGQGSAVERDAIAVKEIKDLKYRQDFHFLAKRCGDGAQANVCTENEINFITDYGDGVFRELKSDGVHNFVSIDSLAIASAMLYGSPIITKCYPTTSSETSIAWTAAGQGVGNGESMQRGISIFIRNSMMTVKKGDYEKLLDDSSNIPDIFNTTSLGGEWLVIASEILTYDMRNIRFVKLRGNPGVTFEDAKAEAMNQQQGVGTDPDWLSNPIEIFIYDITNPSNPPLSKLPPEVANDPVWASESVFYVFGKGKDAPHIKIFLYIYCFMLQYYKSLSKLDIIYENAKVEFDKTTSLLNENKVTDLDSLMSLFTPIPADADAFLQQIEVAQFQRTRDMVRQILKFDDVYTDLENEDREFRKNFTPSMVPGTGLNIPTLALDDLALKVFSFDVNEMTGKKGRARRQTTVTQEQRDKYLMYRDLLFPLTQGPFGYFFKYQSYGAPNNEYYNSLWIRMFDIAQAKSAALDVPDTGLEGEFFGSFTLYFPYLPDQYPNDNNAFQPVPLNLDKLNHGVGWETQISEGLRERMQILNTIHSEVNIESTAVAPRTRLGTVSNVDIYVPIVRASTDILPFIKFQEDPYFTSVMKAWEGASSDDQLPDVKDIININFTPTAAANQYLTRLMSDFYAFVGGVLNFELSNIPEGVWADPHSINIYNYEQPGATPSQVCSTDRANRYRLCAGERFGPDGPRGNVTKSIAGVFYQNLINITQVDYKMSAIEFLIKFQDDRDNVLDFVSRKYNWTENMLDEFISFKDFYLKTDCLFYRFFVKDYLFYSGFVDFSNPSEGITSFVLEYYPELIYINPSDPTSPISILQMAVDNI